MNTKKRLVKEWLAKEHEKVWLDYAGTIHTKNFCVRPIEAVKLATLC